MGVTLDIEELQTFVEVADAGGVSLAARRLGVSKSMVSRRLARLEAELGVQLMARSTRGAALTEAGATFRDYAARATAEIDTAKDVIVPDGEISGRLRIAAPLSFGPTHFAAVLASMARTNPQLHVHTVYSDRFVDLIAEGFDCAIRLGNLEDSTLIARRVGVVHRTLVASPAYIKANGAPETPEELLGHETLMQGTETWKLTDGDNIISLNPRGRFKADNGAALVVAAVEGVGIASVPEGLVRHFIESGVLIKVMQRYPPPEAGVYVIRPPGQHPSRKVRLLIEVLSDFFERAPRL
ncbi:MAG: LysR family transcriptional regulator [Luteimonas sp.]